MQVMSSIPNLERGTAQFDMRKQALSATPRLYLLAVLLDPRPISIGASWLLPMAELPSVSVEQSSKYAISASLSADSRDRCRRYRHDGAQARTSRILCPAGLGGGVALL